MSRSKYQSCAPGRRFSIKYHKAEGDFSYMSVTSAHQVEGKYQVPLGRRNTRRQVKSTTRHKVMSNTVTRNMRLARLEALHASAVLPKVMSSTVSNTAEDDE